MGDAGEAGELGVASEARDAAGLADDLCGDEYATALQLEQLRRVVGDEQCDLALELVCIARELTAAVTLEIFGRRQTTEPTPVSP